MDTARKLIVGYDLCEDYSQISCYSYKSKEPLTISPGMKEEQDCPIPTALCVRNDTKQWLFGEEAISCAEKGEGILIDHLLTKARTGETVELYQTTFTGITLLEKFLYKSLGLIKNYFPTEPITKLVITIRETDPVLVEKIYEALELLGINKDRAIILNHASAYLYYAICQDKSLWLNDVGLFDLSKEGFYYYQIRINRRTKPMVASLVRHDHSQELDMNRVRSNGSSASYIFETLANTVLLKQLVTTLYFTGKGFEGGWADETIRKLCVGRRVFMGQNIYTKGACYAAKELTDDKTLKDIVLITEDMITTTVSLRVYADTKYKEIPLIEAGEIWYEVNNTLEVIVDDEAELELLISRVMAKDVIREKIRIDQIPVRTDRTSRLMIHTNCSNRTNAIIKVTDLGFGEFYPGTGAKMEIALVI